MTFGKQAKIHSNDHPKSKHNQTSSSMKIAITGATGFVGRSLVGRLLAAGHELRCWIRSDPTQPQREQQSVQWIKGELGVAKDAAKLVEDCDALVHAALWRPGKGFRGAEGDLIEFTQRNVIGSLQLFNAAVESKIKRVVYVSSCSVHETILPNRPLDETHPLIAQSHYGAHKAAVEAFIHSFAGTHELDICAIRPTGIYGVDQPIESSKWFDLIRSIVDGRDVHCKRGGKEVHVDDVAKAIDLLLTTSQPIRSEVYACYDRYVSDYEVASIAKELCGSTSTVHGQRTSPKNQITTDKIASLGMSFGGEAKLRDTIEQLLQLAIDGKR
jgi:nucleoside-diphosphate-sugar epimerase